MKESKKKSRISVSIGIPAYNEEKNIAGLIKDLASQYLKTATVAQIIIVSDGSTDKTASIAKSFQNRKIQIIEGEKRKGKAARENEIINLSKSDILVLLDADIVIPDPEFIQKLIKPIVAGEAQMSSSSIGPLLPRNFFEKILFVSTMLKNILYMQFKNGNNIYTCFGPARAFSKKFYQKLRFASNEGEDMFSYFSCLARGFKFKNIPAAVTYYRLPTTMSDHLKQSTRYHHAQKNMSTYFDNKIVQKEQTIPPFVYLKAFLKALPIILKNPLYVFLYLLVFVYTKIISKSNFKSRDHWNVSSTKLVRSQI